MPKKEILIYPDKVLKSRAHEVGNIDIDLVALVEDMRHTMYTAPGVGLAAPQVGEPVRLVLVDPSAGKDKSQLIVLINPVIAEKEGVETDTEMCLSVPETSVEVDRASRILVTGTDLKGNEVRMEANGYLARIFQHEIDHLDGKVILDYASSLKRSIYLKKKGKGTL
ncbi:MAG: peptide deformylase [Desulfomonilia bacterium]|jgi:peptide deformylase|nr:peptide deformylase [Deltaproteobacteria bacterium]MDX9760839.1 peptide deformylase [Desulfomonilia bacterium]HPW69126.1 peptide deformylase [Deltaproteobacteria bacterium]